MKTYQSQSNTKPLEWDLTSSPTTAYHNYNIKKITNENGTQYEYTVDKMTHQEYNIYLQKQINESRSILEQLVISSLEEV